MQNKCIGECIDPGDKSLHPITLEITKNENITNTKVCPSELYFNIKK